MTKKVIQQFGFRLRTNKSNKYIAMFSTGWELFSKRPKIEKCYNIKVVLNVDSSEELEIPIIFNPTTKKVFLESDILNVGIESAEVEVFERSAAKKKGKKKNEEEKEI